MASAATTKRVPFTTTQKKTLFALSSAVGLRMLGLFLVLPVFTLYGLEFTHSHLLAGIAFGAYGLTNAFLQIPLARLSDRIGRKKVLLLGMSVFALGSFVCAIPPWFPHAAQISILILGRLLQGAGVTVSVAFATVADHVQPEKRSTAMAILGIPIGVAFIIGVVGGPLLAGGLGISSLFWLTGILGFGTVALLIAELPDLPPSGAGPTPLRELLGNINLLKLDGGGFLINFFMATFFFYFPLIVHRHLGMGHYYEILLPMVILSAFTMFGFSRAADRGWSKGVLIVAYLIFIPSGLLLFAPGWFGLGAHPIAAVILAGALFYIAFTGLEPVLPSSVSKSAPEIAYGSALGIYNSFQYFGTFAGAFVAGALAHLASPTTEMAVWIVAALVGCLLMNALKLRPHARE